MMKTRVSDSIKSHVHVENDTLKAAMPLDITKVGHFGFSGLFGLMIGLAGGFTGIFYISRISRGAGLRYCRYWGGRY